MRIILIGNYLPDQQESMQRFAQMLDTGFRNAGFRTEIWRPNVVFCVGPQRANVGIRKWLGYVDKWLLFPLVLRWRLSSKSEHAEETRFHICDHSNAPYLNHLPINQTSITCHDVLAIRGGLGYSDAYVPASPFGKLLQRWILTSLTKAKRLAAVSHFTLGQLQELTSSRNADQRKWRVIHNAFNAEFSPMAATQAQFLLEQIKFDFLTPYLLHVGSRLVRKNRFLLLDMAALLGERWQGNICFAGEPVDLALWKHAESLGLRERVISMVKPDHDILVALYSLCFTFVFPSFSEGFGWPVIEAQACGAPVIASNVEPMPEVSGGAALHADPANAQEFADALLALMDNSARTALIQKGFANCHRFDGEKILAAYIKLLQ
ncbi:glycosyltransferase family 1 protein [Hymenobacter sp. UV11]|uniref:glycosyltransferase family 4 protein n=1 Tax=Hymenobacter sp. UV11 TaxID=1849735 RepID=UPI00105F03DF|nr:glycosyltransferase family 1 protein [Hymenobacter sp. UV11]TDN39584.1 glycosyl transferase family 1 [Hymenobacter sp. UV11]TFZ63328.1 glycosyltransferase family 1 protein [Hymenobacter sp. UV11]